MSDEALLKMKQDDWLEACKEIDKLKSDLDLAIEALKNAEGCFAYEDAENVEKALPIIQETLAKLQ